MMIGFLTFGVLLGLTAAVMSVTFLGAGPLGALAAYACFGTLGLLSMAAASALSPDWRL